MPRPNRNDAFSRVLSFVTLVCALASTSCSEEKRDPTERRPATEKELARDAERIRKLLGDGFIVELEKPFVVAGNISRADFTQIKTGTILESYDAFYRQFFTVKPSHILRVYLFKDDRTYRAYAKKLFGDEPETPYGYYSSRDRSLIMNIGTGTGTLVHEMTHALIESDFPQVPAWFNEGLGSLFEQCMFTEHGLKGLVNWRLPILRKAIADKRLTGLRKLVSTTRHEFYQDEKGAHYAEARYFCMYIQELGLLEKFYKEFRANHKDDPTGARTLEKLLGKSLDKVQPDWLKWVATLPVSR